MLGSNKKRLSPPPNSGSIRRSPASVDKMMRIDSRMFSGPSDQAIRPSSPSLGGKEIPLLVDLAVAISLIPFIVATGQRDYRRIGKQILQNGSHQKTMLRSCKMIKSKIIAQIVMIGIERVHTIPRSKLRPAIKAVLQFAKARAAEPFHLASQLLGRKKRDVSLELSESRDARIDRKRDAHGLVGASGSKNDAI